MDRWKGNSAIFSKREKIPPEKIGRGFSTPFNGYHYFYEEPDRLNEEILGINMPDSFKVSKDTVDGFF